MLTTAELKNLLFTSAQLGAKQVLIETGNYKDEISQNRAWTLYGRGVIENLRNRKLIHRNIGRSKNSKSTYSRSEIDATLISLVSTEGYGIKGIRQAIDGMSLPSKKPSQQNVLV